MAKIDDFYRSFTEEDLMNGFLKEKIENIINSTDTELTPELAGVIFSLGRDAENEEEYDYAFEKLTKLFKRDNEDVRAQVIQAFGIMAMLKKDIKPFDKDYVMPLIQEALKTASKENQGIIMDAIDDINRSQ